MLRCVCLRRIVSVHPYLRLEVIRFSLSIQLSQDETYADVVPVRLVNNSSEATSAFLSIMRGCNNM